MVRTARSPHAPLVWSDAARSLGNFRWATYCAGDGPQASVLALELGDEPALPFVVPPGAGPGVALPRRAEAIPREVSAGLQLSALFRGATGDPVGSPRCETYGGHYKCRAALRNAAQRDLEGVSVPGSRDVWIGGDCGRRERMRPRQDALVAGSRLPGAGRREHGGGRDTERIDLHGPDERGHAFDPLSNGRLREARGGKIRA